jgi:phenylacetate-CoA ligase
VSLQLAAREVADIPRVLRAERLLPAELERRRLDGVRRMVAASCRSVPYYRDDPRYRLPVRHLEEFSALPLLTKDDVLAAGTERFHAVGFGPKDYVTMRTSGTTGRVLEVRHDLASFAYHGAGLIRRFTATGTYRPWWRITHLKPFEMPTRWVQRLGLFRRETVDPGLPPEEVARRVLASRPHVIIGYPVMLRGLLRALDEPERARLRQTLRLVMTESELLTEEVRTRLTMGFGVPVHDEYSAYEVLLIGHECRAGALHTSDDRVHVEVVDDAGRPVPEGTEGAVVVTHFRERAMPLVRYRLGDRAVLSGPGCPCGSSFQRLRLTQGRSDDYVLTADGRRVYVGTFLGLAMFTPGVAECMVRQDAAGRITVHLVPDLRTGLPFDVVAASFRQAFGKRVGHDVPLHVVRTDSVEITSGGKGRFVVSEYRPGHVTRAHQG